MDMNDTDITAETGGTNTADNAPAAPQRVKKKKVKPGFWDFLSGDAKDVARELTPYLPGELVAGSIPYIPGTEIEAVWNAASQACGTERVHYCYTIDDDQCWYIATPSTNLASFPYSWCPVAAALPGNSEFWDTETVYLYEQEGQASALRWDQETGRVQLYLGPSRTILPKIQTMDANFVTINPDMADVVPWTNYSLRTDRLSRAAARLFLLSGLAALIVAIMFNVFMNLRVATIKPNLEEARQASETASLNLLRSAAQTFENDLSIHLNRIQELLNTLVQIDGTLVRYEVKADGSVEWDALVPRSFASGDHPKLRNVTTIGGLENDGRVRIRGKQ